MFPVSLHRFNQLYLTNFLKDASDDENVADTITVTLSIMSKGAAGSSMHYKGVFLGASIIPTLVAAQCY